MLLSSRRGSLRRNALLGVACLPAVLAAPITMTTSSGSYTQDFNTLPNSGTTNAWVDDSTIAGWYAAHDNTASNIRAGAGTSTTGGLYSFGADSAAERALGSLGSGGTGTISYGMLLQNTNASAITINALSYTGEQWRNADNSTPHKLTFSYQKSNSPITTPGSVSGWIELPAADFTGPVAMPSPTALDGNLAANRAAVSMDPNISVAAGEYIMLRWQDADDIGYDHGLAIDDLTVAWIINPTGYAAWAKDHANNEAADVDSDGDGVRNGVEYFMGEPSATFTPNPVVVNGKITWPHNASASATYTVKTSTDLIHWDLATSGVLDTGTSIEFTLPEVPPPIFVRLEVVTGP